MSSDLHRNEGPTTLIVERVRTPKNCTFTEAVVSPGNRRWKKHDTGWAILSKWFSTGHYLVRLVRDKW